MKIEQMIFDRILDREFMYDDILLSYEARIPGLEAWEYRYERMLYSSARKVWADLLQGVEEEHEKGRYGIGRGWWKP